MTNIKRSPQRVTSSGRRSYRSGLAVLGFTAAAACAPPETVRSPNDALKSEAAENALLQGRILGVSPNSAEALHVTLATEDGTEFQVTLGPGWYLEQNGIAFSPEDIVTVHPVDQQPASPDKEVNAAAIEHRGQRLELRDPTGRPLWPNTPSAEKSGESPPADPPDAASTPAPPADDVEQQP